MSDDLGHVRIGPRDIYDQLVGLQREIADMRGEMKRANDADQYASKKLGDHETRIRLLEKRVWAIPSAATIIAVMALLWPLVN